MRIARFFFVISLFAALISACGRGSLKETQQLASPHMAEFADFEAWVSRALHAQTSFDDSQAWKHVAFAPLAKSDQVTVAWLRRQDGTVWTFPDPMQIPVEALDWVSLSHKRLRPLQAASVSDPSFAGFGSGPSTRWIVLRHDRRLAAQQTTIAVAYQVPEQP